MITEIDIKDYSEVSDQKLYDVPRETICKVKGENLWFKFMKIDGTYSICQYSDHVTDTIFKESPDICHFAAWTDVTTYSKPKNEKG